MHATGKNVRYIPIPFHLCRCSIQYWTTKIYHLNGFDLYPSIHWDTACERRHWAPCNRWLIITLPAKTCTSWSCLDSSFSAKLSVSSLHHHGIGWYQYHLHVVGVALVLVAMQLPVAPAEVRSSEPQLAIGINWFSGQGQFRMIFCGDGTFEDLRWNFRVSVTPMQQGHGDHECHGGCDGDRDRSSFIVMVMTMLHVLFHEFWWPSERSKYTTCRCWSTLPSVWNWVCQKEMSEDDSCRNHQAANNSMQTSQHSTLRQLLVLWLLPDVALDWGRPPKSGERTSAVV